MKQLVLWTFAVAIQVAGTVGCVEKGDTNVNASTGGSGGAGGSSCKLEATTGTGDHCFRSVQALDWKSSEIALGDMDGDGDIDIVSAIGPAIALNDGTGTFAPQMSFGAAYIIGMTLGDLNGDGSPDVIGMADGDGQISVSLNQAGQLAPPKALIGGQDPLNHDETLVARDFDGDGAIDMAAPSPSAVRLFLGDGSGGLSPGVETPLSDAPALNVGLTTGDWNADGKPDLSWERNTLLNTGGGSFDVSSIAESTGRTAAADLDGSAGDDLAIVNMSDGVLVALSAGNGSFLTPKKFPGGHLLARVAVGDFTGDGSVDVAASSGDAFSDQVWFAYNDGTGQLTAGQEFSAGDGQSPESIAAADLDADGKVDLVVSTQSGKTKVFLSR